VNFAGPAIVGLLRIPLPGSAKQATLGCQIDHVRMLMRHGHNSSFGTADVGAHHPHLDYFPCSFNVLAVEALLHSLPLPA